MPRLLCFTAHPDDEAGAFGGTLLRCAARDVETHVVCLTPGQAATHRGGAKTEEELSAIRRKEFAASCQMLGVSHGAVLEYPDGKLDRQDFYAVVDNLTRRIRQIRPQVIMTIGPEGGITAHTDHSMVAIFATMAFHWAARSNRYAEQLQNGLAVHQAEKLYYATALFTLADRQPVSLSPPTTTVELEPHELETKIAAFKCHASQAPLFPYFEATVRKRGRVELYHLAASATPHRSQPETDLFAGVKE